MIDPQFEDFPDIESEVAGGAAEFRVLRPGQDPVSPADLAGVDAIINCRSRHKLPGDLIRALDPSVRIVTQAGVGFNHIDIAACAERGIPVCNTPDYGTAEVADHAIGLMLSLVRGIPTYDGQLASDGAAWNTAGLPLPPVRRLRGLVFGVVGLGRIGLATALRAKAFGLDVHFHDPYLPAGAELSVGFTRHATLDSLLGVADVLTLHCPLTEDTDRRIRAETLARMKSDSILINTSRGGVVDLDAVGQALADNQICAAALDVLPVEPPNRDHPLLAAWIARAPEIRGRLVITPHAAFYSPESIRDMRRLSMTAVWDYLTEGRLRACVNGHQLAMAAHPEGVPA
ncbi:MAG: hydroxyacid dehydrogenase [Rhodobacteraceae bacterium]|nr:hydroxyacid dehydrogenase [Paracoccaceae bacterium]